jgi:hypothetical protein
LWLCEVYVGGVDADLILFGEVVVLFVCGTDANDGEGADDIEAMAFE